MSRTALPGAALEQAVVALSDDATAASRQHAMQQFLERGFPGLRDEDWRYTDLGDIVRISEQSLAATAAPAEVSGKSIGAIKDQVAADWLVFANGRLVEDESTALLNKQLTVRPLTGDDIRFDDPLADLNAALMSGGLALDIAAGVVVEKPIALLFIDGNTSGAHFSHCRVRIELGNNSQASLIEYHTSDGAAEHYANTYLETTLGAAATLTHVRVQTRSLEHSQTERHNVVLQRDASLRHFGLDLGGKLTRNDLRVELGAAGGKAGFDGLFIGGEGQHIDNHTRVDHIAGPAISAQEYRGILDGGSSGVWNGKAIVHKGADGTDATQANHNLLLSERCEINAKPELEIYADDVKCAHGTTVGQLDEAALFYLQARGIDRAQAQRMLTRAFAISVVEKCPLPALQELVGTLVEGRLGYLGGQQAEAEDLS